MNIGRIISNNPKAVIFFFSFSHHTIEYPSKNSFYAEVHVIPDCLKTIIS